MEIALIVFFLLFSIFLAYLTCQENAFTSVKIYVFDTVKPAATCTAVHLHHLGLLT